MIQPAVIAAVAAVIGGVVAVSVRDSRLVALGLLLALVASPLASSPEPAALAICFRSIGALLATYLLWASARSQSIASEGSGVGAVAELAAVCAAFAVGWFVVPVKPLAGPVAAQAAGIALIALALVPLAGRDVLRVGTGAAVLTVGISLLLQAWVGPATSAQQIAMTVLLVGMVGATSLLISPIPLPSSRPVPAGPSAGDDVESDSDDLPAPPAATPARTVSKPTPAGPLHDAESRVGAVGAPPDPQVSPNQRFAPGSPRVRRLHPRDPRQ